MFSRLSVIGAAVLLALILVAASIISAQSLSFSASPSGDQVPPPDPAQVNHALSYEAGQVDQIREAARQSAPIHSGQARELATLQTPLGNPDRSPTRVDPIDSTRTSAAEVLSTSSIRHPNDLEDDPYALANMTADVVGGFFGVGAHVDFVVADSTGTVKGYGGGDTDAAGWFEPMWCGETTGSCDIVPGDLVTVTTDAGFDETLEMITIGGQLDLDADQIAGTMSGGVFPASGQSWVFRPADSQFSMNSFAIAADGSYTIDVSGFGLQTGDQAEVYYLDANGNLIGILCYSLRLVVNTTNDIVQAFTIPESTVDVEVEGKATLQGDSDVTGWFFSDNYYVDWDPEPPDIEPGDIVTASAAGFTNAINPVGTLGGVVNIDTDVFTGTLDAPWFSQGLRVRCRDDNVSINLLNVDPDGGEFVCDFGAEGVDLVGGVTLYLDYFDPYSNRVTTYYQLPYARANMTWDAVDGWFGVGVHVDFTVGDAFGNIKGGGGGDTNPDGWLDGIWCGQATGDCDLVPGDIVTVTTDAGFYSVLQMITVEGELDLDLDQVSGQMTGGAFPAYGEYGVWSPGRWDGSGGIFDVAPDGSYLVDVSGFGLQLGDATEVYYIDPNGNRIGIELHTLSIVVNYARDWVAAVAAPESTVDVIVEGKASLQGESFIDGWFDSNAWYESWDPDPPDIQPGDIVTVSAAGYTNAINPIGSIEGEYDLAADTVTGTLEAPWFSEGLRVRCRDDNVTIVFPSVDPDGGEFVCDFGAAGVDLKAGHVIRLEYFDPNGNQIINVLDVPFARANTTWDAVDGWFGPGVTVVYTVTDSLGVVKGGATKTARLDGWLEGEWCGQLIDGCDMVPGDQVEVVSDAGFYAILELIEVGGRIDVEADAISGDMNGGVFPAEGEYWISRRYNQEGHGDRFPIDAAGGYSIDLSGLFDARVGDRAEVWYIDPNGNYIGSEFYTLELRVNYGHDWVEIRTNPLADVEIEVQGNASIAGSADEYGWFVTYEHNNDWDPNQPEISPGDVVTATADGYTAAVNPLGAITGSVNADTDIVQGELNAPFAEPLTVFCEIWVENGVGIEVSDVDPQGGDFTCDFGAIGWDIQPSQDIALIYAEPDGDQVVNMLAIPYARANTTWNAVDGWFGENAQVEFQVADDLGNLKGEGSGTARSNGWMDGVNCGCDILPGDFVTVTSDAGFNAVLRPVPITAQIDVDLDQVTGQVLSGVFPAQGQAEDWNHGRQSGTSLWMDIDASGFYTADFSGQFDILTGDWINIWYRDPNGNWLGAEFIGLRLEAIASDENSVYAQTSPNAPLTVEVANGGLFEYLGQADANGNFWSWDNEYWTPYHPEIQTGDTVTVTTAEHVAVVDPVGTITGELDVFDNTVSGTIDAPPWYGSELQIQCSIWEEGGPATGTSAQAHGGGYFCDFDDVGWDLEFGQTVAVYYFEPDNDAVVYTFRQTGIYLPVIHKQP